jgi:hypothetical protein
VDPLPGSGISKHLTCQMSWRPRTLDRRREPRYREQREASTLHGADITAWPPRQIQLLASRHGFLFASDGTPYQPPGALRPSKH